MSGVEGQPRSAVCGMGRAFSPYFYADSYPGRCGNLLLRRKSRVGLGWYSVAPSALDLVEDQPRFATTLMTPMPICTQGTFNMSPGAGIGCSMPRVVAKVANTVLSWFGVKHCLPPCC